MKSPNAEGTNVTVTTTSNASSTVLSYLQKGIANGSWGVGDKLPTEKALCDTLGVSRFSVRSAVQHLNSLGITKSVQGSGTYVCSTEQAMPLGSIAPDFLLNHSDIISILEFRRVLEIASVKLAAQRATMEDVSELSKVTEQMKNATDTPSIVYCDMEFHTLLAKATHNFAIIKVFEVLRDSYLRIIENNVSSLGNVGHVEHKEITIAITMRSPELAEEAMIRHLDYSAKLYINQQLTL